MKSARVFLIGMYLHIIASVCTPIAMLVLLDDTDGSSNAASAVFLLYIIIVIGIQVLGWISVAMAVSTYKKGDYEALRKGWTLLKLGSIPFYIINFIYSFLVFFVFIMASRGFFIVMLPIPIFITCMMIIQSGCFGVCYIKYLRGLSENNGNPSSSHYVLQMLPLLDIISTLILIKKYKEHKVPIDD